MILYYSSGKAAAWTWHRPVMPHNLDRFSSWSGRCVTCGELTMREHCTAYYSATIGGIAPSDSSGGYFTPWRCRCLACELEYVRASYELSPAWPEVLPASA